MTAAATVSRKKSSFSIRRCARGISLRFCGHERRGLFCAPVAIHTSRSPRASHPTAAACVRAHGDTEECRREIWVTRHVPLWSPRPRSRAGGRECWDARLYSSNLCRARFIWTARHARGDEQVGTVRLLWAAVLYLSIRSRFCSIICYF